MALKDDVIGAINAAENTWVFAGGVVVTLVVGFTVKYVAPYVRSWFDEFRLFAASFVEFVKNWWDEIDNLGPGTPYSNHYKNDVGSRNERPIFSDPQNDSLLVEAKIRIQREKQTQRTTLTEPIDPPELTGNIARELEKVEPSSSPKDCPIIFAGRNPFKKAEAITHLTKFKVKVTRPKEPASQTSSSQPLIFTKEPVPPRGVIYSSSAPVSSRLSSSLAPK